MGYTIIKLGQMVFKGVNWVHNDKIGSNGLKKSQLGTQYKYRDYLLRQVVLPNCVPNWSFISLRNPWISVFDGVLLKVELEMWFLQFLSLNLPENYSFHQKLWLLDQNMWFSSKFAVFIKIGGFHKKSWISSKSAVFIKIHGFHENPWFLAFLSELSRGQHQIGILCATKDHLPRKVAPIFFYSHIEKSTVNRN